MAYSAQTNIELIYGADNVSAWANIDGDDDATKIAARIAWAIAQADSDINSELSGCRYTIPFTPGTDKAIVDMSARLAGVLLYESRGIEDVEEGGHQLQGHRDKVEKRIRQIWAGQYKVLTATLATDTNVPLVVTTDD